MVEDLDEVGMSHIDFILQAENAEAAAASTEGVFAIDRLDIARSLALVVTREPDIPLNVAAALAVLFRTEPTTVNEVVTDAFIALLVARLTALALDHDNYPVHWLRLTNNSTVASADRRQSFVAAGGLAALLSFDVARHHPTTQLVWVRCLHRFAATDEQIRTMLGGSPTTFGHAVKTLLAHLGTWSDGTTGVSEPIALECLRLMYALAMQHPPLLTAFKAELLQVVALMADGSAAELALRPLVLALLYLAPAELLGEGDARQQASGMAVADMAIRVVVSEVGARPSEELVVALSILLALAARRGGAVAQIAPALLGAGEGLPHGTRACLQHRASSAVKELAEELAFALCGQQPREFLSRLGPGLGLGLLMRKGLVDSIPGGGEGGSVGLQEGTGV